MVGIIGPNGAGKSTLFNLITGKLKPTQGTLRLGDTVKISHVDQSRETLKDDKTVWEEISGGLDVITLGKKEINSRAYCARFNFSGQDQQKRVGSLSGGERNRVHLAKQLQSGGNLLLLDEPSNDLDVNTLRALEDAIVEFAGCTIVISHDRWFLDRIATHILAFEGDSRARRSRESAGDIGIVQGLLGEMSSRPAVVLVDSERADAVDEALPRFALGGDGRLNAARADGARRLGFERQQLLFAFDGPLERFSLSEKAVVLRGFGFVQRPALSAGRIQQGTSRLNFCGPLLLQLGNVHRTSLGSNLHRDQVQLAAK
jgi:ABC-type Mn2+/Zn2+ transport system ATPase subunit